MLSITSNPYRITGLLVGATAKSQARTIKRLKQFLEAEQSPENDYSFPILGSITRSVDDVNTAQSKLNLDYDKMNAALFWFYLGNPIIDEPAFDLLKEKNVKDAVGIWSRQTNGKNISIRNASSFHNLSTLILNHALNETKINVDLLAKGLKLKLTYLDSPFFAELQSKATDNTFSITSEELQLIFLNNVHIEIENNKSITDVDFIEILNSIEFSARTKFINQFAQIYIEKLEREIRISIESRKDKSNEAYNIGKKLYNFANEILSQLLTLIDESDMKYISIADNIANEVLQCGIDYFIYYRDTERDPGDETIGLFRKAKSTAVGKIANQRCDENIDNLREWIDNAYERKKQAKIREELDFIMAQLELFNNHSVSIKNVKNFVDVCKPKLRRIRSILGENDELFIGLNNAILQNSQGGLVEAVNQKMNEQTEPQLNLRVTSFVTLEHVVEVALSVTFNLGTFTLNGDIKKRYEDNLTALKSIAKQLNISTLSPIERAQQRLYKLRDEKDRIKERFFLKSEIQSAQNQLDKISQWKFGRSQLEKNQQELAQRKKINELYSRSEDLKKSEINKVTNDIDTLKEFISRMEY